ncbi:plastid division protein PDV1-like isoform X2 [Actinidia eriantha]|uniref:plastid division protein PDV1-like isoform X2 n=1 Tax=Actinidia eriantha TaxID=165200 RepID=UPI00258E55E9|nr:plastid division protein PDV1-like isoform X2 [Actinidia eriantha]XP_057462979.1 plastid division protein PDV1-like isoform X2 [Actinidia eriantha]
MRVVLYVTKNPKSLMKWEMEIEEIEAVLEKIWDLHDKLSDAIHSISRSQYLNSVKSLRKSDSFFLPRKKQPSDSTEDGNHDSGFVFVKDFRADDDYSAIQEAKSLNAIRTALENLEDQLEFFHTVQVQQRAERDAAITRLEQSRIVLAMRLAEHQGDNFVTHEGKRSNNLIKVLITGLDFAKKSLRLDQMSGILGNAALVAISMLALLHLHQATSNNEFILDLPQKQGDASYKRNAKEVSRLGGSSGGRSTHLDVMLARG